MTPPSQKGRFRSRSSVLVPAAAHTRAREIAAICSFPADAAETGSAAPRVTHRLPPSVLTASRTGCAWLTMFSPNVGLSPATETPAGSGTIPPQREEPADVAAGRAANAAALDPHPASRPHASITIMATGRILMPYRHRTGQAGWDEVRPTAASPAGTGGR